MYNRGMHGKILMFAAAMLAPAAGARCGQPASGEIEALVGRLGAEEYSVRERATEDLRKLGPAARAALEKALKSKDAEVRERAGMLLREIIWKLSPELAERLGDFADSFRTYIKSPQDAKLRLLTGLRSRAPREARPYIMQAARDLTGNRAQAWIAGLLSIYRGDDVERLLLNISRRQDGYCRSSAADALARFEGSAAVARLLELVGDAEPTVRRSALDALGTRGAFARKHAPLVIKRLEDADETVRAAAARAAARLGDPAALAGLWKLVDDREVSVRVEAVGAIGKLASCDDPENGKKLAAILDDRLPAIRASALGALIEMKSKSSLPRLVRLLKDDDTELAASAAGAISALGGSAHFELLRAAMRGSEDASLAASAAAALIVMGDEKSIPEAARMMTGKNAVAASVVARALGTTGSLKWLPLLVEAEKHWKSESFSITVLEVRSSRLRDASALKPLAEKLAGQRGELSWAYFLSEHALYEEAAPIMSRVLATSLDNPGALSRLGIAELQAGRAREGIARLRRAARMNPFSAINLNNFAWFLLTSPDPAARDNKEALQAASRAAKLAPRTGYILDTYAWALHRNGKSRQGLEQIELALKWSRADNPGEETVLRAHRARMLAALGKRRKALKELSAVLAGFRRDPELALEAARAYCDLGLPENACAELARMIELGCPDLKALNLDPELAPARKSEGFPAVLEAAETRRKRILAEITAAAAAGAARPRPPLDVILP